MNEPPALVTVLIVTYNHARYIPLAIDSVLGQVTDFAVEILLMRSSAVRNVPAWYASALRT